MSKVEAPELLEVVEENSKWYQSIIDELAGCHIEYPHEELEQMKRMASAWVHNFPYNPTYRVRYWLLWSYAHWCRARVRINKMDVDEFDQTFEQGMNFRQYLSYWLYSVGIHQLSMSSEDIVSIHNAVGVSPIPTPLLPIGRSEFMAEVFVTTKVASVPAKDMTPENVSQAFVDSFEGLHVKA